MSRIFQTGFEFRYAGGDGVSGADVSSSTGFSIDTSIFRSGAASFSAGAVGTSAGIYFHGGTARWARFYYRRNNAPTGTNAFFNLGTFSLHYHVAADGSLTTRWNNVIQGSTIPVLSNNTWYCFEIEYLAAGSFEVRVDGVTVSSASGLSAGTAAGSILLQGVNGVSQWFDDVAANDASGASNNSWCGAGKVVLLLPTADSQVGSWTGGAGGTTNLYDALNNTPPVGTASETNTTQIESIDGSGDNSTDEYRPTIATYSSAGIVSGDTINALQGWVAHGEDISTGTKTGSVRVLTNPVDSGVVTFSYGLDGGALGTFPANQWQWKGTNIVNVPSVTLGSSPTMALRKTDTGTRVASACAMGIYVDYTPAAGAKARPMLPAFPMSVLNF